MKTWAEREVELACKRERAGNGTKEGEFDYGVACYESALKAYKSLKEDGHSGCSIQITKQILCALIDGKALTPIEDNPYEWNKIEWGINPNEYDSYQCSRMSSLFKDVHHDGRVTYHDNNRWICEDYHNSSVTYTSGLVSRVLDEMFPIAMPYTPTTYRVICEEFLTDRKNGDFDTVGIMGIVKSGGIQSIDRFYAESEDGWKEITREEYWERKVLADKLKAEDGVCFTK